MSRSTVSGDVSSIRFDFNDGHRNGQEQRLVVGRREVDEESFLHRVLLPPHHSDTLVAAEEGGSVILPELAGGVQRSAALCGDLVSVFNRATCRLSCDNGDLDGFPADDERWINCHQLLAY